MMIIAGMLFGLALTALIWPLLPERPRLSLAALPGAPGPEITPGAALSWKERASQWAMTHLPASMIHGLSDADLDVLGTTRSRHTWAKIYGAALMLVVGLSLSVGAQVFYSMPLWLSLVLVGLLVAVVWLAPDAEARKQAIKARREFARAVAVYVELMAAERSRNAQPTVALENAAAIGDSWAFQRIRQELVRARFSKVQPWVALEELSVQLQVPDLAEAARVMRLSGDNGASVYEPLRALGRNLRVRMLNEEAAREHEASGRMKNIIMLIALMFTVIVLTPMMLTLISA